MCLRRLSVIMSTYNNGGLLPVAIESIREQTHSDFEFIIINDASNDDSGQLLSDYAALDKRIVLVDNEINVGLAASLNRGLEIAKEAWIARMDADDIAHPDRLQKQLAYLQTHPDVDVLSSHMNFTTMDGEFISRWTLPENHASLMMISIFENPAYHPTVVMRTELLRDVGGYNPAYRECQDAELWLRLAGKAIFACLQEAVLDYRGSKKSLEEKKLRKQPVVDGFHRDNVSRLAGRAISEQDFAKLRLAYVPQAGCNLSNADVLAAIELLHDVMEGMKAQGILMPHDLDEAQSLMVEYISNLLWHSKTFRDASEEIGGDLMSPGQLARFYWRHNSMPKALRALGFGITSPREALRYLWGK